jgi:amidase
MNAIRVTSERFVCDLSCDAVPCVEVASGSTLTVHCRCALDRAVGPGPERATRANPATGPIAVTGAQPGQALRFEILEICPEPVGYISGGPGGDPRAIDIRDGAAVFNESIRIPLAPMIGVLGVAPPEGQWSTMDCGPFGGNLDINDIAPGATVTVPVFQPGGLFVLGDVHAVMGDGEIGGQGLEVAAEVTLRVDIEPRPLIEAIYIRRNDELMTVGTAATLEEACRQATAAMTGLFEKHGLMDAFSAMKFLGLAGQLRVGQQCCPIKSVRVAVPLRYVPGLEQALR